MVAMNGGASRTNIAAGLQALALMLMLLALAGVAWLDRDARPALLVLVDRSLSVPRPAADAALAELRRAGRHLRADTIEFAGRAVPLTPRASGARDDAQSRDTLRAIEPSATNLELAVEAALAAHAQQQFVAAVIVSDGRANAGDTERALANARHAKLPLLWLAAARPAPRAWIADVQAPERARRGQSVMIAVPLAGETSPGLRVAATLRDSSGVEQRVVASPDAQGVATIPVVTGRGGVLRVSLELEDADTGALLDARHDAAAVDVVEPARILYLRGPSAALATSLAAGGWQVETVPARRAADFRERLAGYDAVVLDDVSRDDADDSFWQALGAAVRTRGLGLLVLGGERAFSRGGYRDSTLESMLPVLSEPASLEPPVHVVFAVDKSGSMGEGSRGVDRLSLAERAVLETLGTLGVRDTAGVVAFDVEPRLLEPLAPANAVRRALGSEWPIIARGGTRLAPAIELAAAQLESAGPGRRMLIVATDGFVDDAPLESLRRRLAESRIETIALAVGPDADAAALARLAEGNGVVLRVAEAAELPATMSAGLERRRARIERGVIEVQADSLPDALPALESGWPPIAAYAVTRPRREATTWTRSTRGDPVIAAWQVGAGRVIAVTSGLGAWTPQWLGWDAWPELAGGLTDWVAGEAATGTSALTVSDLPDGLRVALDSAQDGRWSGPDSMSVSVETPTGRIHDLELMRSAPGRLEGTLPVMEAGPYRLVATDESGVTRALHLRSSRAEQEGWGVDPRVEQWIRTGQLQPWDRAALDSSSLRSTGGDTGSDRWLVALALLCFLAGVAVDRLRGGAAQAASGAWRAMRRAWSRSMRPKPSRS
jgi:Mg-chelatase subunit ChlD